MTTKQYVLEWSKKSNGFHIQPIDATLAANQRRFIENTSHDWLVLMVGSNDACQRMADNHRDRLIDRSNPVDMSNLSTRILSLVA